MNKKHVLALLAALLLTACATVNTTRGGAVGVERQQSMLVSSAEVNASAARAYTQTLNAARGKRQLNIDGGEVARMRAIVTRLIPVTGTFRADAPDWKWEVNVISSNEVNAWCMPGGKIAVYTGLLEKLQLSDDEAAAVLGHEIAHALREHGREQASQARLNDLGLSLLGAALGLSKGQMDVAGSVSNVAFLLPHSREFETEADRIGVELAARAGYDPRAALSLWEKMMKNGGGQPPQWLSTHPSHQARIADLQQYATLVLPLYEAARPAAQPTAAPQAVSATSAASAGTPKAPAKRRKAVQ